MNSFSYHDSLPLLTGLNSFLIPLKLNGSYLGIDINLAFMKRRSSGRAVAKLMTHETKVNNEPKLMMSLLAGL